MGNTDAGIEQAGQTIETKKDWLAVGFPDFRISKRLKEKITFAPPLALAGGFLAGAAAAKNQGLSGKWLLRAGSSSALRTFGFVTVLLWTNFLVEQAQPEESVTRTVLGPAAGGGVAGGLFILRGGGMQRLGYGLVTGSALGLTLGALDALQDFVEGQHRQQDDD
mmetsp:Transcript_15173/g.23907  ORF Transcript_15173/g.23907 Transcript_15173/m.23907 type:complete len:165 (-) Transcript_15173:339-833(-)